jgi:hypothetical protein
MQRLLLILVFCFSISLYVENQNKFEATKDVDSKEYSKAILINDKLFITKIYYKNIVPLKTERSLGQVIRLNSISARYRQFDWTDEPNRPTGLKILVSLN